MIPVDPYRRTPALAALALLAIMAHALIVLATLALLALATLALLALVLALDLALASRPLPSSPLLSTFTPCSTLSSLSMALP